MLETDVTVARRWDFEGIAMTMLLDLTIFRLTRK